MNATKLRCTLSRERLRLGCIRVLFLRSPSENGTEIDEDEQPAIGPADADHVVGHLAAENAARDFHLGFGEAIDLQHLIHVEADDLALGTFYEQDAPAAGAI